MNPLRTLRQELQLTQQQLSARLGVPVNTFRMWDSGLRTIPDAILTAVHALATDARHQAEALTLPARALELGVHKSTLESAIRKGVLAAQFSTRSVFGRPVRCVTRADGHWFKRTVYGRRQVGVVHPPLLSVPTDYAEQLTHLRRRRGLTQAALAQQIGAASKAVIYQWESRKRIPSPVFWEKVQQLIDS